MYIVLFLSLFLSSSLQQLPPCSPPVPTKDGQPGWYRNCSIPQVPGHIYHGDPFSAFRAFRGIVNPSALPHVLSNPFRTDGTALPCGYPLPDGITARVVVYTEGNNWPLLGAKQTYPDPYLYPSHPWPYYTGLCFRDGAPLPMSECDVSAPEALTTPGLEIVTVVNKANISILITGGTMPGGEQPGQTMVPVNPSQTTFFPVPPVGWLHYLQPEMYLSVSGLDPVDAITWHHNVPPHNDLGTPSFAYIFNVMYSSSGNLEIGFRKNEGYDPGLSPDPEYGLALYEEGNDVAIAVQDLYLVPRGRTPGTPGKMQQDMWSDGSGDQCYDKYDEFLVAGFSKPGSTRLRLEVITHEEAQNMLSGLSGVQHCQFAQDPNCGKQC